MMVRRRDRSPLARTRSSPVVASSAKPCSWKPRVQPRCRGGLERFFRISTRTFFFFAMLPPSPGPYCTPLRFAVFNSLAALSKVWAVRPPVRRRLTGGLSPRDWELKTSGDGRNPLANGTLFAFSPIVLVRHHFSDMARGGIGSLPANRGQGHEQSLSDGRRALAPPGAGRRGRRGLLVAARLAGDGAGKRGPRARADRGRDGPFPGPRLHRGPGAIGPRRPPPLTFPFGTPLTPPCGGPVPAPPGR